MDMKQKIQKIFKEFEENEEIETYQALDKIRDLVRERKENERRFK